MTQGQLETIYRQYIQDVLDQNTPKYDENDTTSKPTIKTDAEISRVYQTLTAIAGNMETIHKAEFHDICHETFNGSTPEQGKELLVPIILQVTKSFMEQESTGSTCSESWERFVTGLVFAGQAVLYGYKRRWNVKSEVVAKELAQFMVTSSFYHTNFVKGRKWEGFMEYFATAASECASKSLQRQSSVDLLKRVGLFAAVATIGAACVIRTACG